MKTKPVLHPDPMERRRSGRAGWLRAAVLGSDDAIVSTASLMIGVAAASASKGAILVAGAMSMAVGEYVSVSSPRDAERADIGREQKWGEHPMALTPSSSTLGDEKQRIVSNSN